MQVKKVKNAERIAEKRKVKRDKKKLERKKKAGITTTTTTSTATPTKAPKEKKLYVPPAMLKNPTPKTKAMLRKAPAIKMPEKMKKKLDKKKKALAGKKGGARGKTNKKAKA